MKFFTQERLNLIVALCAVLISGASFYATYLQADAAKKQVRAMTLPLVDFEYSNLDPTRSSAQISFSLKNSGIGPALVQAFEIDYQGETYHSVKDFLSSCCDYSEYEKAIRLATNDLNEFGEVLEKIDGAMTTGSITNTVIPGQSSLDFLMLPYGETSKQLWEKLNKERKKITVKTCYCSMLGECYWSKSNGTPTATGSCPVG